MNSLLPLQYSSVVRREKILRIVFSCIMLIAVLIIIDIILMLPAYFSVVLSKDAISQRLKAQEDGVARFDIKALEERISFINQLGQRYKENESRRFSVTPLLLRLGDVAPPGISLQIATLQKKPDGTFAWLLTGNAASRDDILRYAEALDKIPEFYRVSPPISNLLRRTNAQFSIEINIRPEYYHYVAQ